MAASGTDRSIRPPPSCCWRAPLPISSA